MADKEHLSVGNDIRALALINIRDIFQFTITAKDEEIINRYGSEEVDVYKEKCEACPAHEWCGRFENMMEDTWKI